MTGVNSAAPTFDEQLLELNESRADGDDRRAHRGTSVVRPRWRQPRAAHRRAPEASTSSATHSSHCTKQTTQRWQAEERRVNICRSTVIDSLDQVHRRGDGEEGRVARPERRPDVVQDGAGRDPGLAGDPPPHRRRRHRGSRCRCNARWARSTASTRPPIRRTRRRAAAQVPKTPALADRKPTRSSLARRTRCASPSRSMKRRQTTGATRRRNVRPPVRARPRTHLRPTSAANGTPSASWRYSTAERKALLPRLSQLKPLL